MRSLVVLFAVIAAAVAAPSLYVPSAVSHQSRVDVHSSPAVVTQYVAEPVVATHVVAEPVVEARAVYAAPAAVSHQSRVDVRSSPAVVASVPVVASAPVVEPVVAYAAAPVSTVYAGGSAVSHQSRVDVQSSPAVVSEHLVAPVVEARSVLTPAVYSCILEAKRQLMARDDQKVLTTFAMNPMVVLFALFAAACGSLVPLAQPAHHPALVLDPHGRPLDTAEVIGARALHLQAKALEHSYAPVAHAAVVAPVAHSVYAAPVAHSVLAPAAVSHQSRVDVHSSPAVVSHAVHAPVLAHAAYSPLLGHSAYGLAGHGHLLKKRSLAHVAYSAPVVAVAPSAVSHQSRVDVVSSPAVVSHAVAAPVVAHAAPIVAHAAPVVAVAPSAVSHQSRVDVRTSPAVVSHSVVAPVAHSVYAAAPVAHSVYAAAPVAHGVYGAGAYGHGVSSIYGAHAGLGLSHGHLLKKRSLAHVYAPVAHVAHIVPSAVSHQSRVDVISKPAVVSEVVSAPVAVAHAVPSVSYAHVAPLAHSAVWTAPAAHLSHSGLFHSALW
ncbi:calphotin-like [Ostrinia nubilalis]|uniref:calphotin-like n=1 Tax=Ostrinia nubilalis TaxID=29057 RepID=UPI0030826342